MRYLNKIIFINSANIGYAEIEIAGNVHFIGTQGVGKSTTLRAILFFYNADKLRLGIEKGKRSFDDHYLPYANSYIIYEVVTENGNYCVMAYRSQGRVAFRFLDGNYQRNSFINAAHKAMSWEQVRSTFSSAGAYSKKIERYEEYRDILYGNNRGLPPQFRKYALLSSTQYQNLPRTVQNVFLNSKLDAEFIKQTIIMSFDEDQFRIDLDQYALHLKSFKQQLSDIGKWSEQNRTGEKTVHLSAAKIAKLYRDYHFLLEEQTQFFGILNDGHAYIERNRPLIARRLEQEAEREKMARDKAEQATLRFQENKSKITAEIAILTDKLTSARRREAEYERGDIKNVILRVGKKKELERQKGHVEEESRVLLGRFTEISQKYDMLIAQLNNQLEEMILHKRGQENELTKKYNQDKAELFGLYEQIFDGIETSHTEIRENARLRQSDSVALIQRLEIDKKVAELKRWFENEIQGCKDDIAAADRAFDDADSFKVSGKLQLDALQKQWELSNAQADVNYDNDLNKLQEKIMVSQMKIEEYQVIITGSKDSFYEWLHQNRPGWENTIGKVIDQRFVLFHQGLSPRFADGPVDQFFGITLDLDAIERDVRSIVDYENEIRQLQEIIQGYNTEISVLEDARVAEKRRSGRNTIPN